MVDMDDDEITEVLFAYRERIHTHYLDGRFKTVIVFKNHGKEAGASLVHSHSQLIALPVVPNNVASQLQSFKNYQARKGSCLMCGIIEREIVEENRIVVNENSYLVAAPFASSSPFQLNVIPKSHSHDFSSLDDKSLEKLAPVLGDILRRLRLVLGEHPWNMVLHNAPVDPDRPGRCAACRRQ